ncbi:MAG: sulfotransferase [Candidatus Acidiferrales bacterium]
MTEIAGTSPSISDYPDAPKSRTPDVRTKMKPPVFIIGSPRSGTTLLYHMLLSAGGFAVYLTESKVFDLVFPRFEDLSDRKNRRKALDLWLQSKLFTLSGLDRQRIENKILNECRTGGDFLRAVMEEIARSQGVGRWAENTPEHILYLAKIKNEIPDAMVVHMIRDGRDVALSLEKKAWVQPFPWDRNRRALIAGLYWEWLVDKGRRQKPALGKDYMEVHYENLIAQPEITLGEIGAFIKHELDYAQIRRSGIGSVSDPNTSFEGESKSGTFDPVGRWRKQLSPADLAALERLIGPTLKKLGYEVTASSATGKRISWKGMRTAYRCYWDFKLWIKTKTPLAKFLMRTRPADL